MLGNDYCNSINQSIFPCIKKVSWCRYETGQKRVYESSEKMIRNGVILLIKADLEKILAIGLGEIWYIHRMFCSLPPSAQIDHIRQFFLSLFPNGLFDYLLGRAISFLTHLQDHARHFSQHREREESLSVSRYCRSTAVSARCAWIYYQQPKHSYESSF